MAEIELQENVIHINRVAKVVKGGRNFAFTALVAVGDGSGNAGIGYGKGSEVPLAIQKAIENAKKNIHPIPMAGSTIVHTTTGEHGSSNTLFDTDIYNDFFFIFLGVLSLYTLPPGP